MYRRPRFLEKLLAIRREMSLEADYDVIAFALNARAGSSRVTARSQPVTRVVTDDENTPRRSIHTKTKTRSAVKK